MVPVDDGTTGGEPAAPFDEGTLVGKRYVTEDEAIELLCTKPGAGSLSLGDAALAGEGRQAPCRPPTEVPPVHVGMILEMASDSLGDRVALGPRRRWPHLRRARPPGPAGRHLAGRPSRATASC